MSTSSTSSYKSATSEPEFYELDCELRDTITLFQQAGISLDGPQPSSSSSYNPTDPAPITTWAQDVYLSQSHPEPQHRVQYPRTQPNQHPKTYNVDSPSFTGVMRHWQVYLSILQTITFVRSSAALATQGISHATVERQRNPQPSHPQLNKPQPRAYTVFRGIRPGVYRRWYVL
jgi:hypothetical protein